MQWLKSFSEILGTTKALFFDINGVFRTDTDIFQDVHEFFIFLRQQKIPFWFITNEASKLPQQIGESLSGEHIDSIITEDQILTSGLALSNFLHQHHYGSKIAYLGPQNCGNYISMAGCKPLFFPQLNSFDEFDIFALMDTNGYDWHRELNRLLNLLKQNLNIPIYAPNPDIAYPNTQGEFALASGALAHILEISSQRQFKYFGKPEPEIFSYAFKKAQAQIPNLKVSQCLMVGDTYHIDILGAHRFGMPSCLVLTGNTKKDQIPHFKNLYQCEPQFVVSQIV